MPDSTLPEGAFIRKTVPLKSVVPKRAPGRTAFFACGPADLTGTYSVDSNCIVTDEWGGSIHHSVIYGHGKGYFIINSSTDVPANADTVNSGEAIRQ